jgi:hypothetical protein
MTRSFVLSFPTTVILLKYASGPSLTLISKSIVSLTVLPQQHLYLKIDIRYFDKD